MTTDFRVDHGKAVVEAITDYAYNVSKKRYYVTVNHVSRQSLARPQEQRTDPTAIPSSTPDHSAEPIPLFPPREEKFEISEGTVQREFARVLMVAQKAVMRMPVGKRIFYVPEAGLKL